MSKVIIYASFQNLSTLFHVVFSNIRYNLISLVKILTSTVGSDFVTSHEEFLAPVQPVGYFPSY